MDSQSSTKRSSYQKHSVVIYSFFFTAEFNHSLSVNDNSFLIRFSLRRGISSVCDSNNINVQIFVKEFKIVHSKSNVTSIFVAKNNSISVLDLRCLENKPTLKFESIRGCQPNFFVFHVTFFGCFVPFGVLLNILVRLCGHVEKAFLLEIDIQKQRYKCHGTVASSF